jgi:hypothetical protein
MIAGTTTVGRDLGGKVPAHRSRDPGGKVPAYRSRTQWPCDAAGGTGSA